MTWMDSGITGIGPRQVLADEVYSRLSVLIISGRIAPDTRINIEDVARTLGVSPTPVREALARLESDELVEKLALKGYRTTPLLSDTQVAELYDLRRMLEPLTARRAASRLDEAGAERLRAELQVGREADALADTALHSQHDARLHDLVFELAGNETARHAYNRLHVHLHLYRRTFGTSVGSTIIEHTAIVDALVRRDEQGAEDAMNAHLGASRALFDSFA